MGLGAGAMPIELPSPLRRISQEEIGEIAYEFMEHVFAIHREFGRLFNEGIYKLELAARISEVRLEVPIRVTFGNFCKPPHHPLFKSHKRDTEALE